MIREFSAGGVVVRDAAGAPFVAPSCACATGSSRCRRATRRATRAAADAARREVREETGVEAEPVEKLGDVRYWYVRGGERVLKIVAFFLFRYRSGERRRTTTTRSRRRTGSRSRRRRSGSPTRASGRWPLPRCHALAEGR